MAGSSTSGHDSGQVTRARAIMLMGTGSDAGKSLLVAGLCRAYRRRGLAVSPFKPQNMSNNAAVTQDGGEIGRAQALQARAAGVPMTVHLNPVLLKPQSEIGAQIVCQGKVVGSMAAREYQTRRADLMPAVLDSFERIVTSCDLVIVEGAGSASEVNLRAGDIANMGFAEAAGLPVVLIGDIDRGGVIASIVGTPAVLPPDDRVRLKGFMINKFRGDTSLFEEGMERIADLSGLSPLGIVPFLPEAGRLPPEDAMALDDHRSYRNSENGSTGEMTVTRVGVLRLPRIANFDDFDPLRLDPGVELRFIDPDDAIPGTLDWVILPGSKATLADLRAIKACGWDIDLKAHYRRGGRILGICGGYQMLGRAVRDPTGLEGPKGTEPGLGYLDFETEIAGDKTLLAVSGHDSLHRQPVAGYEMHVGRTTGPGLSRPFLTLETGDDGAVSPCGRVMGGYLHGLFASDGFRAAFLAGGGDHEAAPGDAFAYESTVDATLDHLADHLERHLDLDRLLELAAEPTRNDAG